MRKRGTSLFLQDIAPPIKAIPHNSLAAVAMPFPSSAACRFLDLQPVNLQNLQLHLTKNSFATAPTHLCGIALNREFRCGMRNRSSQGTKPQEYWRYFKVE